MTKYVRLDKYLADAGAGTRSEVKKMIRSGKVRVGETVIRQPEFKVASVSAKDGGDAVLLNGVPVLAQPEFVYYLLHKPKGCVSATEDRQEKTVMEYVPDSRKGLFPVGRLDKDTEGLLLITNDGALAHELLSPGKHVEKTYYAVVQGVVTPDDVQKVSRGLDIGEDKETLPGKLEILNTHPESDPPKSEIRLTICEGKFRQVKRMMHVLGKEVLYLKRISMGPLTLPENLKKGECRLLSEAEISALKNR